MKTRTLIIGVVVILAVLIIIGNYAIGEDEYVLTENEEIYGTWVNTNYPKSNVKSWFPQKIIIKPGGIYEYYSSRLDLVPASISTFTFSAKWIDSEGNVWYRMIWKWKGEGDLRYEIGKINKSGQTWEFINSWDAYPTEIDPNNPEYHIYYRQ
ncbi:MAG: hypothetical protein JSV25_04360 [Spirochaetota bacterium]|nr:MAG: hypothetical protein JSV25_04360 [Spirochaetota bacterium]